MKQYRVALILLVVMASTFSAACAPPPPPSIRVAVNLPLGFTFGREMEAGLRLAFSQEGNKIGTVPIQLIVGSSSPDGQAAIAVHLAMGAAQIAIADPSIIALIGTATSTEAKAVIPLTSAAGLTHISPSATWPGLTKAGFAPGEPGVYYPAGKRNFFRILPADDIQGVVAARWAQQNGQRVVFVVSDSDAYSDGLARIFTTQAADSGLAVVGREKLTRESLPILVNKVVASKADMLYYPMSIGSEALGFDFLLSVRKAVPNITLMGGDGLADTDVPAESARLEGMVATQAPNPNQLESAANFVAAYQAIYGTTPSPTALIGYEAGRALISALKQATDFSRESVLAAMRSLGVQQSALGRWQFDANGDTTATVFSIVQFTQGRWLFKEVIK